MSNTIEYSSIEPLKDKFLSSKFHITDAYDMKEIAEILEYIALQGATGKAATWKDVMDNFMRNLFEDWAIRQALNEITLPLPGEIDSTLDTISDLSQENNLSKEQSPPSEDNRTIHE